MTTPFTPRLIASSPTACQYRPASLSSPSIIVDPCEQNTTGVGETVMLSCMLSSWEVRWGQPPSCRHSSNPKLVRLQASLLEGGSRSDGWVVSKVRASVA